MEEQKWHQFCTGNRLNRANFHQPTYKGTKVGRKRVDFVIDEVMVEIKAKAALGVNFVQALSYLKASGYKVGLLLNFGASKLQIKRLAN